MTTTRLTGWLLISLAFWGSFASVARAQNVTATERRLNLLLDNTQRLTAEITAHYHQVPQFGNLSAESSRVWALASQVRGCLLSGDIAQATRDLCEVERLARNIQNLLEGVDQFTAQQRLPRAYRVNTRQAFRTAQFVEDYAVDLKDDIRDLPRRPVVLNGYGSAYPGKLLPSTTYRSPPVLENPRPQTFNYPPTYPPQRTSGQAPGPTPGPDPTSAPEILPEPRGIPLQAPGNANPPTVDRET